MSARPTRKDFSKQRYRVVSGEVRNLFYFDQNKNKVSRPLSLNPDTLPTALRDYGDFNRELLGYGGRIHRVNPKHRPLGSIAREGAFEDDKKQKEETRNFYAWLMREAERLNRLIHEYVWKMKVVQLTVNEAIDYLDEKVSRLQRALDPARDLSRLRREVKTRELQEALLERKLLRGFRDTKLKDLNKSLKNPGKITQNQIDKIDETIDKLKSKSGTFRNIFEKISKTVKRCICAACKGKNPGHAFGEAAKQNEKPAGHTNKNARQKLWNSLATLKTVMTNRISNPAHRHRHISPQGTPESQTRMLPLTRM